MEWVQNYDPLGSRFLSTVLAALPILVLLGLLVAGLSAARAACLGLLVAFLVSILGFGMPWDAALAAAGNGAAFGLLPIGWIVFGAVFLYHLTLRTGQFEIIKQSVAAISPDRRIQALLIAFSFGAFIEGAAGFGTPVAISSALLIGLGFAPMSAACLALVANTSPVAFGALGTPITTLAKTSLINEMSLSQMAGRQLPLFSLIVPFWIVAMMAGPRGIIGAWPAILVCGGSFALIQFLTANFHGPTLVDVAGGLGSMIALILFLRVWRPKEIWTFSTEDQNVAPSIPTTRQVVRAWIPWVLLSAAVFTWGWPDVKQTLNGGAAGHPNFLAGVGSMTFSVPKLDGRIYRQAPVARLVDETGRSQSAEVAEYIFPWLSATGTSIFLASILSAIWLGIGWRDFWSQFFSTLFQIREALVTISLMLALAFVTKFSGADATLGLAFTHSGWLYPFFAPLLGWLGVALTGSDTSSNALFGSLQRITAEQLQLNPTLIVASNSTGGVMGKMIDAQSIVVAAVATKQHGSEGRILLRVLPHSLALAFLVGLLTLAQAYPLSWMVP
ncbi:L-lactate permease [bacterium]|nr:L-lactate permease [bacterium]